MYTQVGKFLNHMVLGNSMLRYLVTVFVFVAGMLVIKLIIRKFIQRIKKLAERTASTFDDFLASLLETIVLPLLYLVVVYLALKSLVFPELLEKALNYVILGIIVFFAVRTAIAFIGYGFKVYLKKQGQDAALEKSLSGIMSVVKLVVWAGAHFLAFGDFSLIFEIVYYVIGGDYNKYMDIQQQINFAIKEEFEKRKIEFAYPTQTIYFSQVSP